MKNLIFIGFIATFIILIFIAFRKYQSESLISSIKIEFDEYRDDYKENEIIIKNPLDNTDMIWEASFFTQNNWPDPYFDLEEKKQIFEFSKQNPRGYGVIDVGAHIGDLAIPLALALSHVGRNDIMIYAIDPSRDKCNFIRRMAYKNRIENIKIFNCGLSEDKKILGHDSRDSKTVFDTINTGGQKWDLEKSDINITSSPKDAESNVFLPLDFLFDNGEIGDIGIYHIDVEGHEIGVLRGSSKMIHECKPILFLEHWIDRDIKKCQSRAESPGLFREIDNLRYQLVGFLANDDMIFYPQN